MIRLRPLERNDLRQLRDWRNSPEIFSRVREYRPLNMENQEAWFNNLLNDQNTIMFGIEADNGLTGVCGLTHIDWIGRKAEVSIYIGKEEYRGRGLGVEVLNNLALYAFGECNLQRLWAEVYSNNPVSMKLFERAGYYEEGRLRRNAFKNGAYQDSIIYGLLLREWEKKDARQE